jgi:hypothetical protein
MSWSILSTVLVAGALLASPAFAVDREAGPVTPDDRLPPAQKDTPSRPDLSRGAAPGTPEVPATKTIEGKVAAVEHDSGRLVLATDDGLISVMATPDQLAGIEVGDVVQVSLEIDENDTE